MDLREFRWIQKIQMDLERFSWIHVDFEWISVIYGL